jgi:hypothetical protein
MLGLRHFCKLTHSTALRSATRAGSAHIDILKSFSEGNADRNLRGKDKEGVYVYIKCALLLYKRGEATETTKIISIGWT